MGRVSESCKSGSSGNPLSVLGLTGAAAALIAQQTPTPNANSEKKIFALKWETIYSSTSTVLMQVDI